MTISTRNEQTLMSVAGKLHTINPFTALPRTWCQMQEGNAAHAPSKWSAISALHEAANSESLATTQEPHKARSQIARCTCQHSAMVTRRAFKQVMCEGIGCTKMALSAATYCHWRQACNCQGIPRVYCTECIKKKRAPNGSICKTWHQLHTKGIRTRRVHFQGHTTSISTPPSPKRTTLRATNTLQSVNSVRTNAALTSEKTGTQGGPGAVAVEKQLKSLQVTNLETEGSTSQKSKKRKSAPTEDQLEKEMYKMTHKIVMYLTQQNNILKKEVSKMTELKEEVSKMTDAFAIWTKTRNKQS